MPALKNEAFSVMSRATVASPDMISPEPVQPFVDGRDLILIEDLPYTIGDSSEVITVPRGFVTDFASIPHALWSAGLTPTGRYQWAAVVNDYLYWNHACPRNVADIALRLAMMEQGVKPAVRDMIYRAVEVAGQKASDDDKSDRDRGVPKIVPMDEQTFKPVFPVGGDQTWVQYRAYLAPVVVADLPTRPSYCAAILREAAKRGIGP